MKRVFCVCLIDTKYEKMTMTDIVVPNSLNFSLAGSTRRDPDHCKILPRRPRRLFSVSDTTFTHKYCV